jgi:hypothetical protein
MADDQLCRDVVELKILFVVRQEQQAKDMRDLHDHCAYLRGAVDRMAEQIRAQNAELAERKRDALRSHDLKLVALGTLGALFIGLILKYLAG